MNRRTVSLCLVILVAGLFLGWVSNLPSIGQSPPPQPPAQASKVGKYQVSMAFNDKGVAIAIMCDTETGQTWEKMYQPNQIAGWQPTHSPVVQRVIVPKQP